MKNWLPLFIFVMTPIVGGLVAASAVLFILALDYYFGDVSGNLAVAATLIVSLIAGCPGAVGGLLLGSLFAKVGDSFGKKTKSENGETIGSVGGGCLGAVIGGIAAFFISTLVLKLI